MTLRNRTMRDILSKLDQLLTEGKDHISPSGVKTNMDPRDDDYEINYGKNGLVAKDRKARGFDVATGNKKVSNESFQIGDDFGLSFSEDFEIATEITDLLDDGVVIDLDDQAINYLTSEGFTFEDGELSEGVAGPKSCWKGYRKVGTKPGTGRNAGKRVNDCEKIGEGKDSGINWRDNSNEVAVEYDGQPLYIQPDSNGDPIMLGSDLNGYWGRDNVDFYLEFEANISTGEILDFSVHGANTQEYSYDEEIITSFINEAIEYVHKSYGKTWEEIKDEAFGGVSVDAESIQSEAEYHGKNVPLGKKLPGDVKKSKVYVRKPNGKIVKVNFGDKKMRIKKSNPKRRKSFRARHNCKNPGPRWKARYWSCRSW